MVTLEKLNREYNLNISNADEIDAHESSYNCMGFALGTYEWEEVEAYGYGEDEVPIYDEETGEEDYEYEDAYADPFVFQSAVDELLSFSGKAYDGYDYEEDAYDVMGVYPSIRLLQILDGDNCHYYDDKFVKMLKEDEYLITYRLASDDFHYARRMSDGRWYHKRGYLPIEEVSDNDLFNEEIWHGRYYGDIAVLAVKPHVA